MKKTNQKGSVTLFVLVACLFFIFFLTSMFMLAAIERQAQIEATKQTQNIYSQGNANEIYQNYFTDSVIVPIYTKAQLFKMCTGEQIAINEEGGKIYTFSENSVYLLQEDITFEHDGVWEMPSFGETGRIEGNGKKITIKDTSKEEEFYYYYTDLNRYKEPLTEEGYLLSWDTSKVSTTKVEESTIAGVKDIRIVPIPEGFVMSSLPGENTVSGGLVIYQGTDQVTDADEDGNSIIDAQESRNQFVWIPVDDINQMVMCKSNSSNSICDLELQANVENEITTYTLKCETHNSADLCGRLYYMYNLEVTNEIVDEKTIYGVKYNFDEVQKARHRWDTSNFHEPNIVTTYDKDTNTSYLQAAGVSTANELLTQLIDDFNAMAISVAKYRGFYVSRYEAGANGASLKNQAVLVAGVSSTLAGADKSAQIKGNMWYGMYKTLRDSDAIDKTAVSTHMLWRKPV